MVDVSSSGVRASNDLGGVLVKALGLPQNIIKLSMSFEVGKPARIECECVVVPEKGAVSAIALELQRFEVRLKEADEQAGVDAAGQVV